MEACLDVKAVSVWRDSAGAAEAQSEILRSILCAGASKQKPRTWFIDLPGGTGYASAACTACLLAIGAQDYAIATAECGNQRHLVVTTTVGVIGNE